MTEHGRNGHTRSTLLQGNSQSRTYVSIHQPQCQSFFNTAYAPCSVYFENGYTVTERRHSSLTVKSSHQLRAFFFSQSGTSLRLNDTICPAKRPPGTTQIVLRLAPTAHRLRRLSNDSPQSGGYTVTPRASVTPGGGSDSASSPTSQPMTSSVTPISAADSATRHTAPANIRSEMSA